LKLYWKDVHVKKKCINLSVRTKCCSRGVAEDILIFQFPIKSLCPVRAVIQYKKYLKKRLGNLSRYTFLVDENFSPLPKRFINKFLKVNFPKKDLSGHSFRAGIPSSVSPDLVNDLHIMGWGRWKTKAFLSYQKFKFKQKKWVFRKIVKGLTKNYS